MTVKCMAYRVSGKVQGVWYRDSTVKQAAQIGVTGWVRNMADGCVEVLACGEQSQLDALYQWLMQGPLLARVEKVEQEAVEVQKFDDFVVRYD